MRKVLISAASAAALLATPALADDLYQDDGGWYLRANGGYGMHHDADFDGGLFQGDIESEGGPTGTVGIGYEFGEGDFENFRIELDGDTMWTDMGQIGQNVNSFAKLRTNTLMANIIYDFDDNDDWDGEGWDFVPYIGAGIGLVQGKLDAEAHDTLGTQGFGVVDNPACFGAVQGECSVHEKDTTWGWQLLAGLGVNIDDNLTWDTHYTYMRADTGGLDFDGAFNANAATANTNPLLNSFVHQFELDDIGAHTLVTGLRYKFGSSSPRVVEDIAPTPDFKCWDGNMVFNSSQCAARPVVEPTPEPVRETFTCWDGQTIVYDRANCPAVPEPTPQPVPVEYHQCPDGSTVTDPAYCPAPVVVQQARYNNCGPSNVAIFNVPVSSTPKSVSRLGTMPEFGDSHGLTPTQFFNKLQSRYSSSTTDKAYLNYLFKSMGYSNGFADANEFMFSEEVLDVGTAGLLGLGEVHHYEYSVLPSSDRDRQAFRIQSANGSVVHFMKTCGNYFYACN